MSDLITLYRPVGTKELKLIEASGYRAFPPRLPSQPIFYPVLNEEYATQIAREWNTKYNDDRIGYVTRFSLPREYAAQFQRQIVGNARHEEMWVPAEQLAELNARIVGQIEVISKFIGEVQLGKGSAS